MPIDFNFRNVVNKRGVGTEVLHSSELYIVSAEGTFTLSLQPLMTSPIVVWYYIGPVITPLTKTLVFSEVIAGSGKWFIDSSTRTIFVDPNRIGDPIYVTYSSDNTHVVGEEYALSVADEDGLCRVSLQEAPLEFDLASTDSRKIYITATRSLVTQVLQETKDLVEVVTTANKYYVEFDLGRITFNPSLIGSYINATYYGYGSIVWAEDIKEIQSAIHIMDANVVDRNGSNVMTGDLTLDNSAITYLGTGTVDTVQLATHNHQGGAGQGVMLDASLSVIYNTVVAYNLNNKAVSGSGAVATINIQDNAVTPVELLSDKISLARTSGGIVNVGVNNNIGVNMTPLITDTAQLVLRSLGTSSDKLIFHDTGAGNTCGINVDASGNLNIFSLLNKNIYFTQEAFSVPANFIILGATGEVDVTGNITAASTINTVGGKLQEKGNPLLESGTKMLFYQTSVPAGWQALVSDLSDYALRIVNTGTGGTSAAPAGSLGYGAYLTNSGNTHSFSHGHSVPAPTYTYSISANMLGTGDAANGDNDDGIQWWTTSAQNHEHRYDTTVSIAGVASTLYGYNAYCKYVDCIIGSKI